MNRKTAAQCLSELGNLTRLDVYRLLVRTGLDGMNIGDIQSPQGKKLDRPTRLYAASR